MSIRVLLADDHSVVREALRIALAREVDLDVVAEAGNAHDTMQLVQNLRPDVVVLDIGLPDLNGMEVAARLRRLNPAPRIVALSAQTHKRFVTEMLRSGAHAYVTKSSAGSELVRAIRAVAAGRNYFCPEASDALAAELRIQESAAAEPRLGQRERQVLRLIAEGLRSGEIAERLHIALTTVEVHRRNILRKLQMRGVADLTKYAIREGIVEP